MEHSSFVADLAVVLGVASVTAVLAKWARQPTIVGYLLAGLIVGPYLPLPLFADAERVHTLAEFGVVLVMFAIGLEFRLAKLFRVLPTAGLSGLVQVSFLLWCGFALGSALGWNRIESIFLGAGIAISSTMVVTRVFAQQPVRADIEEHVLAVLVIQDVLAVALIAAMTAVAQGGELSAGEVVGVLGELLGVLSGLIIGGLAIVPRVVRHVAALKSAELNAVFALGLCFCFAILAEYLGYSVALGAFIAGVLVAESGEGESVEHLVAPMRDTFAGVFFVSVGMTVDPRLAFEVWPISLGVLSIVIAAQFFSIGLLGVLSGLGLRRAVGAGLALGQIGEFGFILAAIGSRAGVVSGSLQPVLVTVAVLSAITTPIAIRSSDRITHALDAHLPRRIQHALALYEAWVCRIRTRDARDAALQAPLRARLIWMGIDAVALLLITGIGFGMSEKAVHWLSPKLGWDQGPTLALVSAAILIPALPLLTAYVRHSLSLAKAIGDAVVEDSSAAVARVGASVVELGVGVSALLGLGVPAMAIALPVLGGPWAAVVLAAGIVASVALFWRRAGRMEGELHSGLSVLAARVVSSPATAQATGSLAPPKTLAPGVDDATPIEVDRQAYAVGRSLAELDIRARTGAFIVAISRRTGTVSLPAGHDTLSSGDTLWCAGTPEAIEEARALLTAAAPATRTKAASAQSRLGG